jgi:uncharacterized protein
MKRFLAAALLLAAVSAVPATAAPLPSRPSGYVTDAAGVINRETKAQMETLLTELEQKTSAQVAVVTIDQIKEGDINSEAVALFKKWGIGKKGKDNGVLFLIAPHERKMRIEVGYGLEGIIPDGKAGRIRDELVLPAFREGDLSRGIFNGTLGIAGVIAENSGVTLSRPAPSESTEATPQLSSSQKAFALLFFIFILFVVIRHPWLIFFLMNQGGGRGWSGGGFGGGGGGGFGGFGGGSSGGGGASGGW